MCEGEDGRVRWISWEKKRSRIPTRSPPNTHIVRGQPLPESQWPLLGQDFRGAVQDTLEGQGAIRARFLVLELGLDEVQGE